jgi:GH15 family glucan-1,4-alpha-glucosidase
MVLKLLIHLPEGLIMVAPTASLSERIGGQRNWDYRCTWLRDYALQLFEYQLFEYQQEASNFMGWLERVHDHAPSQWQITYGVDARFNIEEQSPAT